MTTTYHWRGEFRNDAVNQLHAEAFRHRLFDDDWWTQVNRHSLGWVCARDGEELVGFVNVAWDGALHAFVLDTMVAGHCRRRLRLQQRRTDQALKDGNRRVKTALISVAVLVVVLLDLVASIRLGRATVHSRAQQLAWLMLVWLVPFIGAVLAVGVLSESNLPASPGKSGESGSGVWIPGIGGDDGGSGGHPG